MTVVQQVVESVGLPRTGFLQLEVPGESSFVQWEADCLASGPFRTIETRTLPVRSKLLYHDRRHRHSIYVVCTAVSVVLHVQDLVGHLHGNLASRSASS